MGGKTHARGSVRSFLLLFVAALAVGTAAGLIAGKIVGRRGAPATTAGGNEIMDAAEAGGGAGADQADGSADNPYAGFRIADFRLLDQDGISVDEHIFDGHVTVLTFFFTSCNGPCPEIAKVMRGIQDRTADDPAASKLRLVSISVDGGRDTPTVIRSFGESYGADPTRWRFLTGSPEVVREMVKQSIGFELREQDDVQVQAPDGSAMKNILHPTRLMLVGPDRRLIGVYWYTDPAQVEKLIADAREALG